MTFTLNPLNDPDLLTLAGLVAAVLDLCQSHALALPRNLTLRALAAALIWELEQRNRQEDVTRVRVLVVALDQLTEWSDGAKLSKHISDEELLS